MSPERFTLENMFAMELHKYQDVAEEIVNHAIKVPKDTLNDLQNIRKSYLTKDKWSIYSIL